MGDGTDPECRAQELFDEFVSASTCRATLLCFSRLCEHLQLDRGAADRPLYQPIQRRLNYWKANALWAKLDRRAAQPEYRRAKVCSNLTCVIIGAGPCGLRTAVELSFMGARVVVLEKRDSFSRNNVLHLWPFTIHDLRGLGAKKFYGKFCAGSIDHISIRQLQLVLLKVALLLGAEVHVNVEFRQLLEPPEDEPRNKEGWRMEVSPRSHPLNQLEFDVVVGADGRRNTLAGFKRKEFRGKLAIAITANFKNRNTSAEAKVEELSGVAFIFNQRFFQELRQETGIDLENIVYYKDDTHYFVMTAKKQSLLDKGVILQDFADTELLLSRGNVDHDALQMYAREAADFSTNHQLPFLDFAMNHYGQPDVAMFDFTCMYASENAALVLQRHGHQLLVTLVGDSLLEPFWPMGTGVARGFLAALDSAWMIRSWAQGDAPLDVLAERESLYRLLPQTTPENMQKNISLFTVDPSTRYLNISPLTVTPAQVRHLVDTGEKAGLNTDEGEIVRLPSPRILKQESFSRSNQLLAWCQEQTRGYKGVAVRDLTTSWKSGLALCALIHRHRPDLINYDSLDKSSVEDNIQLVFDVAEREFGIPPLMTVDEMSSVGEPDSLSMVMYLSQFYQLLRELSNPTGCLSQCSDLRAALITPASLLSRLGTSPSRKRNPKEFSDALNKRRRTSDLSGEPQESCDLNSDGDEPFVGGANWSRVRLMANQLQAKLDESSAPCTTSSSSSSSAASAFRQQKKRTLQQEQMSFRFKERIKSQSASSRDEQGCGSSAVCCFCQQKLYVMERLSAEGLFFHRSCFCCASCGDALRPAAYAFNQNSGRFYCLQYPDCQLSVPAARRRPTASQRTSLASVTSPPSLPDSVITEERRRSSAASVMERIELEIYRRSSKEELQEEPEEVSEETLNHFNLSGDHQVHFRCSPEEEGGPPPVSSEEVTSAWSETLQEDEEEEGSEEESSDEGEFSPWEAELRLGLCLLSEEEEEELSSHTSDMLEQDSSPSLQPSITSSVTPPTASTPSTATFFTSSDSAPELMVVKAPLSSVNVTEMVLSDGRGRGSFDDITPELPQKKNLPKLEAEDREAGLNEDVSDGGIRGRKPRGAQSLPHHLLPPLHVGGGANCLQLTGLIEAPPPGQVEVGVGGARSLWKTMFPGNRKVKKKGGALPAEMLRKKTANQTRATATGETSDLDSSTLLQRCSLKPQNNLHLELLDLMSEIQKVTVEEKEEANKEQIYVPHALAFRRSYPTKKQAIKDQVQDSDGQSSCPTEVVGVLVHPKETSSLSVKESMFQKEPEDQDLDSKMTRSVQRAARRQAKQEELKRLHKAQMIQRQLQHVEVKQRELEERGVMVEKALRGEADYWGDSAHSPDLELHLGGLGKLDNLALMQQWFLLVQQKNSLVRYESELMIFARELELEDRQSRLQQELRDRMAVDDHLKEEEQLKEERLILQEMLEVVEQRDALVSLLEEQRLLEHQEDQDLEQVLMAGPGLGWT